MIYLLFFIITFISFKLILEKDFLRNVFGYIILGNVINICIYLCGKSHSLTPAFIDGQDKILANPLPQALILTAIVIGFALLAFLFALLKASNSDMEDE